MRSLMPIGRSVIERIVFAAFVTAFFLAIAKSVLVSVLPGL